MRNLERSPEGAIPDSIGAVTKAIRSSEMSEADIQRALEEAGQLVIVLSRKRGTGVESPVKPAEGIVEDGEGDSNQTVERTIRDVHDQLSPDADFFSRSGGTDYNPLLPDSTAPGFERRVEADQTFDRSLLPDRDDGRHGYTLLEDLSAPTANDQDIPAAYESLEDRMNRLIDQAAALLADDDPHADLLPDETKAAVLAARKEIDALKYPGGFRKNPLKVARTLRNVWRFINGSHSKEVKKAEDKLYEAVMNRAAARLRQKRTGTSWSDAGTSAAIERELKAVLPASFQVGSGWRAALKRKLEDTLISAQAERDEMFAT